MGGKQVQKSQGTLRFLAHNLMDVMSFCEQGRRRTFGKGRT